MILNDTLVQRFWPKVEKTETCWTWTANRNNKGYGLIRTNGKERKQLAHRVSWVLAYGPITPGAEVAHTCDNPSCVRPDHLTLMSHRENMLDMHRKGRARPSGAPVKLTNKLRRQAKELRAKGVSLRSLAAILGVGLTTVKRALH